MSTRLQKIYNNERKKQKQFFGWPRLRLLVQRWTQHFPKFGLQKTLSQTQYCVTYLRNWNGERVGNKIVDFLETAMNEVGDREKL